MLETILRTRIFLLLFLAFVIGGTVLQVSCSNMELFMFINKHNYGIADEGFKIITQLGHGLFTVFIVVLFLVWRFRYSLMILTSYLASGIVAQFLKRVVFPDLMRPAAFCEGNCHFVDGVKLYFHHSFPSGHAASAFALFLCLSFMLKKNFYSFIFFLLALITAYSRVYLSQHFFRDVYFGALIGVSFALFSIFLIKRVSHEWIDKSLITLRKATIDA